MKILWYVVYFIIEEELNLTKEKAVLLRRKGGAYQIKKIGSSRPIGKNPNRGAIERFRSVFECFFREG